VRLAISNIAWAPAQAREVYALMAGHGFTGLEVAPALAFPDSADPFMPDAGELSRLHGDLTEFGLTLVSMQSLLFGVSGAQLFGTAEERARFEQAMGRALALAGMVGIPNLVFGSPRQRAFPDGMGEARAMAEAAEVFARLGDRAQAEGTVIAIEPNPASYGTNFLTTVADAARFVADLAHPAIALNFDLGALYANGETAQAADIYRRVVPRVSHVHISEPELAPAPADTAALAAIANAILAEGYEGWFSIEMRQPNADPLAVVAQKMAMVAATFAALKGAADAQ